MEDRLETNKATVVRFNKSVIEQGDVAAFHSLMDEAFVNRTAPPGSDNGPQGMLHTFNEILRPGLPNLRVEIFEQVAEGDMVTTRKRICGTHTGTLFGILPTGREVSIDVIDIIRLKNGKYIEHWDINNLPSVLTSLSS